MKCPKCSAIIDDSSVSCCKCGNLVSDFDRISYFDSLYFLRKNDIHKCKKRCSSYIALMILAIAVWFILFNFKIYYKEVSIEFTFTIIVCILLIAYNLYKKKKLNDELLVYKEKVNVLQLKNNYAICKNCGFFMSNGSICFNCGFDNTKDYKKEMITPEDKMVIVKIIGNIIIAGISSIAFTNVFDGQINIYSSDQFDLSNLNKLLYVLPAIIIVSTIAFILFNIIMNKMIVKAKLKRRKRD